MPDVQISDLHTDIACPIESRGRGDTDFLPDDSWNTFPDVGSFGEHSPIQRLFQFGITQEDLRSCGVENPFQLSEAQYGNLMKAALGRYYETVMASIFIYWKSIDDADGKKQMEFIRESAKRYENWGLRVIGDSAPKLHLMLEGGDVIRKLSDIDELKRLGLKMIGIQYNKPNDMADANGLTPFGIKAVEKLFQEGFMIDLAHSNRNVISQVLDMAETNGLMSQVSYTHGGEIEDMKKDPAESKFPGGSFADIRGISMNEISRIAKGGGIVGLGVTRPFYGDKNLLSARIYKILQLENGPSSIGLGTDFGGIQPGWEGDFASVRDLSKLAETLSERFGLPDEIISRIMCSNVTDWVHTNANRLIA